MELIAEKRKIFGKKTKKLRRELKAPGVIFGKGIESVPITVGVHDFKKVFAEAGETNLVDVKVDDSKHTVLIKEVQYHPVNDSVVHINLHEVDLKAKINAEIPVRVEGEEENALVKSGEALVLTLLSEITVDALPSDLPDEFVVDVTGLAEVGAAISISDLAYDKTKVELVGYEEDDLVVKLDYAVQAEEEEEELTEEEALAQLEVTGESADSDEGGESADSDKDGDKDSKDAKPTEEGSKDASGKAADNS